jgi:hypothetical protein
MELGDESCSVNNYWYNYRWNKNKYYAHNIKRHYIPIEIPIGIFYAIFH